MKKAIIVILLLSFSILLIGCDTPNTNAKETSNLQNETSEVTETKQNVQEEQSEPEGSQPSYDIYISGFSDSLSSSAVISVEYSFANQDEYNKDEVEEHKSIEIGAFKFDGNFSSSGYFGYNYFPTYQYINEKVSFSVDSSGVLTGFLTDKSTDKTEILTQENCVNIAKDLINNFVDAADYKLSVTKDDEKQVYTVKFTKNLGNYTTSDSAVIKILYTGKIYSFSSFMLGKIDCNTDISSIDIESVNRTVTEKLDKVFDPLKEEFDKIEYGEYIYTLTHLKEGNLGIVCTVNVDCIEEDGEYSEVTSERIELVVVIK